MCAQAADRTTPGRWPIVADMMQHESIAMSAPTGLDLRWKALAARDSAADGTFVYGVTSTGVYCRPSCPSRRPRADRVKFFDTGTAARQAGFRPCKRCKPDQIDVGVPGMSAMGLALLASAACLDHVSVLQYARREPPPPHLVPLAAHLEAIGVTAARAGYWRAYELSFITRERVKVASTDMERIREYRERANAAGPATVIIDAQPCEGRQELEVFEGWHLCK